MEGLPWLRGVYESRIMRSKIRTAMLSLRFSQPGVIGLHT